MGTGLEAEGIEMGKGVADGLSHQRSAQVWRRREVALVKSMARDRRGYKRVVVGSISTSGRMSEAGSAIL